MLARHCSHYSSKNEIKGAIFPSKPVVSEDSTTAVVVLRDSRIDRVYTGV